MIFQGPELSDGVNARIADAEANADSNGFEGDVRTQFIVAFLAAEVDALSSIASPGYARAIPRGGKETPFVGADSGGGAPTDTAEGN
jgi:hypothetical protein